MDENSKDCVVIIELKQRSQVSLTDKDAVVLTRFSHGIEETNHPSYQAWSYATLLYSFNETVERDEIQLEPCAYLHNYKEDDGIITNAFYQEYLDKSPIFLQKDKVKLQQFIKKFVKYGDKNKIMYRIDEGKIRPSK